MNGFDPSPYSSDQISSYSHGDMTDIFVDHTTVQKSLKWPSPAPLRPKIKQQTNKSTKKIEGMYEDGFITIHETTLMIMLLIIITVVCTFTYVHVKKTCAMTAMMLNIISASQHANNNATVSSS